MVVVTVSANTQFYVFICNVNCAMHCIVNVLLQWQCDCGVNGAINTSRSILKFFIVFIELLWFREQRTELK